MGLTNSRVLSAGTTHLSANPAAFTYCQAPTYRQVPELTGHGGYAGCFGNAGIHGGGGGTATGLCAISLSNT